MSFNIYREHKRKPIVHIHCMKLTAGTFMLRALPTLHLPKVREIKIATKTICQRSLCPSNFEANVKQI